MPRIRSIKPENRTHRKVGMLSDREYKLWISMISEADDEGRLVAEAGQLRVQTWPYHPDVTTDQVEQAIQKLAELGLIRLYQVSAVRYAMFPSWHDHQHPKYPTPSKLPAPTSDNLLTQPLTQLLPQDLLPERRGVELSGDKSSRAEGRGEERSLRGGEPATRPSSKPSDNGQGKRMAPPPGTWEKTLAEIKRQHPELTESEHLNLAMQRFQQSYR